ncbi:hypothetical protein GTX53_24305 [Streptomyces sp. SID5594]|uniref:hypothetical protein n=1 Tax=unclassified Streptomyces TaxID=2593676 RepID=UPI00035F382F|nr:MULTISPECIES: hypothetical protein [unclassified Streptomyces]MZF56915.1 hypothetical protein [Streptomyces sp. SID5594]
MNTVWIQDGDGEWTAIGTMADDSLLLNEPDPGDMKTLTLPPVTVEIVVDPEAFQAALRAAAEAYVRTYVPIAAAIVENLRAAAQAAEAYNPAPPPGRRRDRPAWQSPYGPPTRHHR